VVQQNPIMNKLSSHMMDSRSSPLLIRDKALWQLLL